MERLVLEPLLLRGRVREDEVPEPADLLVGRRRAELGSAQLPLLFERSEADDSDRSLT